MEAERQSVAEHASVPADSRISSHQVRNDNESAADQQNDGAGIADPRSSHDRQGKLSWNSLSDNEKWLTVTIFFFELWLTLYFDLSSKWTWT